MTIRQQHYRNIEHRKCNNEFAKFNFVAVVAEIPQQTYWKNPVIAFDEVRDLFKETLEQFLCFNSLGGARVAMLESLCN